MRVMGSCRDYPPRKTLSMKLVGGSASPSAALNEPHSMANPAALIKTKMSCFSMNVLKP